MDITIMTNVTLFEILTVGFCGLVSGLMGPFLAWRRLSFFGDAIAHSSLLIIGLATLMGFAPTYLILPFAVGIALILNFLEARVAVKLDTLLVVLFSGLMGLGMIFLSKTTHDPEELIHLLFGGTSPLFLTDTWSLFLIGTLVLVYLHFVHPRLIFITLQPDMAFAEGLSVRRHNAILIALCASLVAVSLKLMGVLMVTSLLIAPTTIVRPFTKTMRSHLMASAIMGGFLAVSGFLLSKLFSVASGAAIASLGLFVFIGCQAVDLCTSRRPGV